MDTIAAEVESAWIDFENEVDEYAEGVALTARLDAEEAWAERDAAESAADLDEMIAAALIA